MTEQKPIAWVAGYKNSNCVIVPIDGTTVFPTGLALFTAPPDREQVEQEPVAWVSDSPTKGNGKQLHFTKADAWKWSSNITPLYTAPPQRERVWLTDDEIGDVHVAWNKTDGASFAEFARLIRAKLKEKNHG